MFLFIAIISRLSILSTLVPSKTHFFLPFLKRECGNPCLLCRDPTILFWFTCSMGTCILFLLIAPFGWPFVVISFKSPLCQLDMYLVCLDSMLIFLFSSRGLVSHSCGAYFNSCFSIWCSSWASCIYFFGWLIQANLDYCYFSYISFLSLIPSY